MSIVNVLIDKVLMVVLSALCVGAILVVRLDTWLHNWKENHAHGRVLS